MWLANGLTSEKAEYIDKKKREHGSNTRSSLSWYTTPKQSTSAVTDTKAHGSHNSNVGKNSRQNNWCQHLQKQFKLMESHVRLTRIYIYIYSDYIAYNMADVKEMHVRLNTAWTFKSRKTLDRT